MSGRQEQLFSDAELEMMRVLLARTVEHYLQGPAPIDPVNLKAHELVALCHQRGNVAHGLAFMFTIVILNLGDSHELLSMLMDRAAEFAPTLNQLRSKFDPKRN